LIDDSDDSITRNITSIRMRKNMTAVLNTRASYEVCFENRLDIDYHNPVIMTTGFYIDGSEEIHYIENVIPSCDASTDNLMSALRLYYIDEQNIKIPVDKEFGTVNFTTGELLFGINKPINITGTVMADNLIMIRSIPFNNGQMIESKGSVYLDFDVATSSIAAVVDGVTAQ